jgi:hypothetical protein
MDQAAEYVAARMRGYRLHPALEGHRVEYAARTHRIQLAELLAVGADSVRLQMAYDFWPDGRSDSGHVVLHELHLSPRAALSPIRTGRPGAAAVLIDGAGTTHSRLDSLASAGFEAAIIVQPLTPVAAMVPVPGLTVVQVTPATAAWMLGLTRPGFEILWEDEGPSVRSLPRRVELRIGTEAARGVTAVNVLGYLAGREPRLMEDLVIVAANLDAAGTMAGERVTDYRQIGTGVSAMLEIARNEERVSRRFTHPMRTVMFAAFSGNRSGHQGLQAFLQRPTWSPSRVRTMIYLGLSEEDEPTVRALLEPHGIELVAVRTTVELPFERRYVFSSERSARSRSPVPRTDAPPPSPESSAVNARALEVALDLARLGHAVLQEHAGMVPITPAASLTPVHHESR